MTTSSRAQRARKGKSQPQRLLCACVLIAMMIAGIAASGVAETASSAAVAASDVIDGTVDVVGDEADAQSRELFESEVLPLDDREDVRTTAECSVVGFYSPSPAEKCFSEICADMAKRGWIAVESGSATIGSFAKEAGVLHWAFVSCVSMGGESCVVIQVA